MLLKRYKIQVIEPTLRAHLLDAGKPAHWIITAHDLPSAWGKFCRQRFGVLLPNPADYDISFHSTQSI